MVWCVYMCVWYGNWGGTVGVLEVTSMTRHKVLITSSLDTSTTEGGAGQGVEEGNVMADVCVLCAAIGRGGTGGLCVINTRYPE